VRWGPARTATSANACSVAPQPGGTVVERPAVLIFQGSRDSRIHEFGVLGREDALVERLSLENLAEYAPATSHDDTDGCQLASGRGDRFPPSTSEDPPGHAQRSAQTPPRRGTATASVSAATPSTSPRREGRLGVGDGDRQSVGVQRLDGRNRDIVRRQPPNCARRGVGAEVALVEEPRSAVGHIVPGGPPPAPRSRIDRGWRPPRPGSRAPARKTAPRPSTGRASFRVGRPDARPSSRRSRRPRGDATGCHPRTPSGAAP
jgi:hypothetical protein